MIIETLMFFAGGKRK